MCMDQTLVDVSAVPDIKAGDVAVIIGRSGDLKLTACDLAMQAGTISNEILSRLGERLVREII
ncbi:MAG: alanine racemase C-terminal domain-containing protein [Clostridiaceae bacterium]|nr:alanine racemase C-terminal domain-containing protein [Clostridiaceae bacterium]